MRKIIILDYNTKQAHIYNYSLEQYPENSNLDLLIEKLGFELNSIDYMSTTEDKIINH